MISRTTTTAPVTILKHNSVNLRLWHLSNAPVVTSLLVIYAATVEFLVRIEYTVKEGHNFTMYLVLAFTTFYLVGVVYAELTKNRGIVSDMIHGGGPAGE